MDYGEWEIKQLPITKEVYVACGTELIAGGLTEANAQLIAQAPRFYEACKALMDYAQPSHKINVWEVSYTELQKVIKAITKVEEGK